MNTALHRQFGIPGCPHRLLPQHGGYVCQWVRRDGLPAPCSQETCTQFRVAADFIPEDAAEVPHVNLSALERYLLREFIARRGRVLGRLDGACLFCCLHQSHHEWCPLALYERLRDAEEKAEEREPALAAK